MTKRLLLLFCTLTLTVLTLRAQSMASKRLSPSAQASAAIDDILIDIDYSQPGVKGRTIWGVLVPYDKVWRTGANEATTFTVNKDILIEGQLLPAGRYALFSIPGKKTWTIIFNKEADQWGAYNYNNEADILRVEVPNLETEFAERMTFEIEPGDDNSSRVFLKWEKRGFSFEVKPAGQP